MCQLRITSAQPPSSSHPQQYQGQRLSRGRGISRNALLLWLSSLSKSMIPYFFTVFLFFAFFHWA